MQHSACAVSQMLTRNEHLFENRSLLVCGALEDTYPQHLAQLCDSIEVFVTDYNYYRSLANTPLAEHSQFNHCYQPQKSSDTLLLYLPKSKAEARYLLAVTLPYLKPGSLIILAGENRGGIRSAPDLLAPYCSSVNKQDSARRCSLYVAQLDQPAPAFDIEQWINHYPLPLGDEDLTVCALPGVFSSAHLDDGTLLLLEHLPSMIGKVLDFGCGAGVIGSLIKRRYPDCTLDMVDINALALESSRRTLAANNLEAQVYASDVFSDIDGRFSAIVSNPPFHAGLKTHYDATEQFLDTSHKFMTKGGKLLVVANAFLRYPPIMEARFKKVKTLANNRRFRVYQAAEH